MRSIIRVYRVEPVPAGELAHSLARERSPTRVFRLVGQAGCRQGPDNRRGSLDKRAVALFAEAQRLLGPLPVGHVPRQSHREAAVALREGLGPDLNREDRPILATVSGLERDRLSDIEPPLDVLKIGGGDVGVEVGRSHPDQLVPCVAQALARPTIHVKDHHSLVKQEERVGGMVHECPEPLLALPQRRLGPLEIGGVYGAT